MAEYIERSEGVSILRAKANMAVLMDAAPYFEKAAQNSVIYRLGKIKTETGLDARKFWDLVKLLEMEES